MELLSPGLDYDRNLGKHSELPYRNLANQLVHTHWIIAHVNSDKLKASSEDSSLRPRDERAGIESSSWLTQMQPGALKVSRLYGNVLIALGDLPPAVGVSASCLPCLGREGERLVWVQRRSERMGLTD